MKKRIALVLFFSFLFSLFNVIIPTSRILSKTVEDCLSYEAATYNRDKAIAYAEKYWDRDTNIDGRLITVNGVNLDCAHFVSCCIGNPEQRYLSKAEPYLCGGLSIESQRSDAYGIVSASKLRECLTQKKYTIRLGKCVDTLTLKDASNSTIRATAEKLSKGDYIHITWKSGDTSQGHAILFGGYGEDSHKTEGYKIYSHNGNYHLEICQYLSYFKKYDQAKVYFVKIYDDPIVENQYQQKFQVYQKIKNTLIVGNDKDIRVRTGPGGDYYVSDTVYAGKRNALTGKILSKPRSLDGRVWYLVEYNGGKRGWIREELLEETEAQDDSKTTVTYKLQVLDAKNDEPIVRAMVSVIDGDGGNPIQNYTDGLGRVDVIGKPSGKNWNIEISKEGYESKELNVRVDEDKSDTVKLSPLEKVSITIYVFDIDGNPLHRAKVTIQDADQVITEKYTDKDGKTVFDGTRSTTFDDKWNIRIELEGFKPKEWEQYVLVDGEIKITLYLDDKSGDGGGDGGLPDLVSNSCNYKSSTVIEGDSFFIAPYVKNEGQSRAGSSHVKILLSPGDDWDTSDDVFFSSGSVVSFGVGQEVLVDLPHMAFPRVSSSSGDTYQVWIITVVDSNNEVTETNESNIYKSIKSIKVRKKTSGGRCDSHPSKLYDSTTLSIHAVLAKVEMYVKDL